MKGKWLFVLTFSLLIIAMASAQFVTSFEADSDKNYNQPASGYEGPPVEIPAADLPLAAGSTQARLDELYTNVEHAVEEKDFVKVHKLLDANDTISQQKTMKRIIDKYKASPGLAE